MPTDLETVDIPAVEIMAAGGPFKASSGDEFFTPADLQRIAADSQEVAEEAKPPNKIGHSSTQKLAANSGMLSDDEKPALGWLSNFRADGDKMLADLNGVPKKFAGLLKSKAFRTRSVELASFQSQKTGRTYPNVVRALGWLGAKAPAIRTLDDIAALYEDAELPEGVTTVDFAEEGGGKADIRVGILADDEVIVPTAALSDNPPEEDRGAGDTNVCMATLELNDEQRKDLADTLGIELGEGKDEITSDVLLEKVKALKEASEVKPEDKPEDEPKKQPEAEKKDEPTGVSLSEEEYEKLKADATAGREAADSIHKKERETFLSEAVKACKIAPAELDEYRTKFDEAEEMTRFIVSKLPVSDELVKTFGEDGPSGDETVEDRRKTEEQEYRSFAERMGIYDPITFDPTEKAAA